MKFANDSYWVFPMPGTPDAEALAFLKARGEAIAAAKADPLRYGYEPDFWAVCRALLGMKAVPRLVLRSLAERTGLDEARCWETWRDTLCANLGLRRFVKELLANGANRAGKTDFAAKLCHELGESEPARRIWIGSQERSVSLESQQPRVWKYLPADQRRDTKSATAYIKYSEKNGFTDSSFVLRNGSRYKFLYYTQQRDNALEGAECHLAWMDEEVPLDWVEALRMRIASTDGRLVMTFTPISGYTPVVADYLDRARVARWSQGYMLPRDGKEPRPDLALGLNRGEYSYLAARSDRRDDSPQTVPGSRAEDCSEWGMPHGILPVERNLAPERSFELVPRVAVVGDGTRAAVWFHGRDNPYGNPLEVIAKASANRNAREEIKTRVYGLALKAKGRRFRKFDRTVHVV